MQGRTRTAAVLLGAFTAVSSSSIGADRPIAPRAFPLTRDINEFYFPASMRLGETGRVVLRFLIDENGVAVPPFVLDKDRSSAGVRPRLEESASRILQALRFDVSAHARYKQALVVSFIYEIRPCGSLQHEPGMDYTYELCRDPLPPPRIDTP